MGNVVSIQNESKVPVSLIFFHLNSKRPARKTVSIPKSQVIKVPHLGRYTYVVRLVLDLKRTLTVSELERLSAFDQAIVRQQSHLNSSGQYTVKNYRTSREGERILESGYLLQENSDFAVVIENSEKTVINLEKYSCIQINGEHDRNDNCYYVHWDTKHSVTAAAIPNISRQNALGLQGNGAGFSDIASLLAHNAVVEEFEIIGCDDVWSKFDFSDWKDISGNVFKCFSKKWSIDVALKSINNKDNLHEIELLKSLQHQNIVAYYGVLPCEHKTYLVMEYANYGSIHEYLNKITSITEELQLHWAFGIANGMVYLHNDCPNHPIIHRDLKPANILLFGNNLTAKISDFGCSKPFSHTTKASNYILTLIYAAPEVVKRQPISLESDVFSYGATIFEIVTLKQPYEDIHQKVEYITNNINVPCPESVTNPLLRCIIENCFVIEQNRPSFINVQNVLRTNDVSSIRTPINHFC